MNESRSKEIALKLLKAVSTKDVDRVINAESGFGIAGNWKPYGGSSKNWDRVGVQTSEPVGAFAELIINSIDAILMRKAHEANAESRGDSAPRSMVDAVKRFFSAPEAVPEGKIAHLSKLERTRLAEKSVLVGVKRATGARQYPTYTIADFGEGQNPDQFPKTLLSLGGKNKERIPFVQGRFNMGGTGSIVFCTQGDVFKGNYKFVLSKQTLTDSDGLWGWTLIRVRPHNEGEVLPVAEYFCPDGKIARFRADKIHALGREDIGVIDGGAVVKLYEYDIGPGARAVDFGLYDGLTTNLLECALPVRIYDFDAKPQPGKGELRAEGIAARTFSGMKIAVTQPETNEDELDDGDENVDMPTRLVCEDASSNKLGVIRVYATGIKKLKQYLLNYPFRCFYTVNGQAQAKERASFFRKAKLDDLRNHLIVQVDCNEMNNTARSAIFKPDRQRMSEIQRSRELQEIVLNALKDDGELREYARRIRARRVSETVQDTEKSRELWALLVKNNPELRDLFGAGEEIVRSTFVEGGDQEFNGEKFPSFLRLVKPQSGAALSLPINTYRRIECETDAENEYLGRELDPGSFFCSLSPSALPHRVNLRNGKLRITVWPPKGAQVGQTLEGDFGFEDSSRPNPLTACVKIVLAQAEETNRSPSGNTGGARTSPRPGLNFPDIQWVAQSDWGEYGFDEESGAACVESDDGVAIYVNADNKRLKAILAGEREESEREMTKHLFLLGVGILTLSMHHKLKAKMPESENWEEALKLASSAISAQIVALIRKLGGQRQ